jgi:hypothetical protein
MPLFNSYWISNGGSGRKQTNKMMSRQRTRERKSLEREPAPTRRSVRRTEPEHPTERKLQLRIQEAEARWRRTREKILVGSVVYLIFMLSLAGLILICSNTSTAVERQSGILVLGTLFSMVLGAVVGKNFKWRS